MFSYLWLVIQHFAAHPAVQWDWQNNITFDVCCLLALSSRSSLMRHQSFDSFNLEDNFFLQLCASSQPDWVF
jgi:hypothetical protein